MNSIILQASSSDLNLPHLAVLAFVILFIILIVQGCKKEDDTPVGVNQTNKVVNVPLTGGIVGLFSSSPQRSLNNVIKRENANGWRVVQIITADSGNIFLYIFRLLLLIITLFLFTTSNGYYLIMEKK